MRHGFLFAACTALPLLAGCQAAPPAASLAAPAAAPAAAAVPGPAGTRFDGHYVGPNSLTVSNNSSCGPMSFNYVMTVRNGAASLVLDRTRGATAEGQVQADGSFALPPTSRVTDMNVSGRIVDGVATGEARGRSCTRSFTLRRTG